MIKKLFGGGGQSNSSSSGFFALPPGIQGNIQNISQAGEDLINNAGQYFAPMGLTAEELMVQQMINPANIGESVNQYLNPFRDIITEDINKQFEAPVSAYAQRANEAGAFGGSRHREGQADLERVRLDSISRAMADQYNNAFGQMQQGIGNLLGFGGLERGLDLAQRGALAQAFNIATGGSGLGFLPSTSQSSGSSNNYGGIIPGLSEFFKVSN